MKRHASQLSLILAAFAFAPAALAGPEVVKCTDPAGHVTLTDQPCESNAATVRLSQVPAVPEAEALVVSDEAEAGAELAAAAHRFPVERHVAAPGLLRQANWKTPPAPGSRLLARDVATLKQARLQLQMMDSTAKRQPRLAGLR
jgi:hypothetical protein